MSLFGQTTVYTSASISDDMLILTRRTRTNASHSESRILIDKISSVTHSVIFGKTSITLLYAGLILLVVGVTLSATYSQPQWSIITIVGALLACIAFLFREHSILVDCSGDCHSICVGRKNTDEFYLHLCAVLKMKREGKPVADMTLTGNKDNNKDK